MKSLQNNANIAEIESRLNKYAYLSKNTLPGSPDGRVFMILQANKRFPDRKVNPNFYYWYILMKQFSQSTIAKWINDELYLDQEDTLINQFVKLYASKKDNSTESTQNPGSEFRSMKFQNSSEIQYTIDITLKDYNVDKMKVLRKLLDEYKAEMTEDQINHSKYIRILCKIDPANLDQFSGKVSKCIEFDEFSLKKKDMKGQKTTPIAPQQDKNE